MPDRGFFLGPCLFDQVTPAMALYPDEIFGPVLCVVRVETYDEAAALISENPYANGVAIFTRDGSAARRFEHEVDAGMVGVNVPIPVPMAYYSFGGWKQSLFGDTHVHGPEGVHFNTRAKVVTTRWGDPATRGPDLGFPRTRSRRAARQVTVVPPSTAMTWPVRWLASGESRKPATEPMSAASATTPRGTSRLIRARDSSLSHAPAAIGVFTAPGQMQFDPHTARSVLDRGEAGERDDPALARGVAGAEPVAPDPGSGGDRHDAAARHALGALEVGQRVLHREEGAGEVHGQRAVERRRA